MTRLNLTVRKIYGRLLIMLAINIAGIAHGSVRDLLGRRQDVRSFRNGARAIL